MEREKDYIYGKRKGLNIWKEKRITYMSIFEFEFQ